MSVNRMQGIDLSEKVVLELQNIFASYPEVEKVIVFGSRALGNAKTGSDIDLAFSGRNLTSQLVGRIQNYLEEETNYPYFFDCVHFEATKNKELLQHIHTHGMVLYDKIKKNPE